MKFGRSKFYHWHAGLPRLDLVQTGCETQFIGARQEKERKTF